jgi:hypothetical protein
LMPDTGKDIFATLHDSSLLLAVPCARILMMPMPNQPIKLTDILLKLGRLRADDVYAQTEKFNPHINNIRAGDNEQKRGLANALLMEAKMLETEAHKKREMAFTHVPSLRPAPASQPYTDTIALNDGQIHDSSQLSLDSLLKE